MVLVFDKPYNAIGILQTKLRYREGHKARRGRLETMPLDKHIEGRHGESQARLTIGPAPVHDLFEMADERQHREHRLHEHALLPLSPLTEFGVPVAGVQKATIRALKGNNVEENEGILLSNLFRCSKAGVSS